MLRVTSLCVGNSPGTGEFPAQMASNAEIFSIWWRHHDTHRKPLSPLLYCKDSKITEFEINDTKNSSTAYGVICELITSLEWFGP